MQVDIKVKDNEKIHVNGPYSSYNISIWKSLGGMFWNGVWVLPDNDPVRNAIAELFGKRSEIVKVKVPASNIKNDSILQIGGYVLANRRYRDQSVQMPHGVSLYQGAFPNRGGSVKNPNVDADDSVVFQLACRKSFRNHLLKYEYFFNF